MKRRIKYNMLILIIGLISPLMVNAARGCCSQHGGVVGCNSSGRQICADGTLSPSCKCTPVVQDIYGCMDSSAKNYNYKANKDDGSCQYYILGCTDKDAKNFNETAEKDDGTCEYYVYGCMNKEAKNYNPLAEKEDNSCEYYKLGCTDDKAINYDETAEKDDGSCKYKEEKSSDDDFGGALPVLTVGGLGAYFIKKKLNK